MNIFYYYNFDVLSTKPAPIYVLIYSMTLSPFKEQRNIIDVIPGGSSYNDFWQVYKVIVPGDYVVNSIIGQKGIMDAGYQVEATNMLVNCPVVLQGSTAKMRLNCESPDFTEGW